MDTSNWKIFRFGDVIDEIYKAKAYRREDLTECSYTSNVYPFVTRTEENNSVECFTTNNNFQIEKGNALVIGDTTATATYQEKDFVAGDHIVVIRAKWLNKSTGLFISTLLNKERYRYCYGRAFVMDLIKKTKLSLPATSEGNPDWQYMEDYIQSINQSINRPITQNHSGRNVNTIEWKNFRLTEIFTKTETGKISSTEFLPDGQSTFYMGAKKEYNGIMLRCGYDNQLISKGNCIVMICDGQGSIGYNNYMDIDFIGTVNLTMGYNKYLNKYTGCFLVTLLDLERPKYSFGRKRKTHLKDTIIKLPATSEGTPDWKYMEDYIKSLPYGDCI